MSDLNVYTCTGRLGADPDCRTFASGDPVVNLRIAVSERWKKEGEAQEKTLWLPVTITNKGLCNVVENYLRKGSQVALSGKLESRSYQKDGATHYVTELVLGPYNSSLTMLDSAGSSSGRTSDFESVNEGSNPSPAATQSSYGHDKAPVGGGRGVAPKFDDDGDIPFMPERRV